MLLTDIVASDHIYMGRLVTDTWRTVAWESHRAVLRFSSNSHPPSSLLKVEGLVGEHGEIAFEDVQYPRPPYWTATKEMRDLLEAVVFLVVLNSLLISLFMMMPS